MTILGIAFGSLLLLLLGYRFYGRFLIRRFEIDDARQVPSQAQRDGVDFVPTPFFVVLGHHFSSIAGAGPIVGPVLAALFFGWGPSLVWILVGSVFVGGVHDLGALMASLRHRAVTVADVAKEYMNSLAGRLFLVFIWLALVYVIIVFLDLTASGFTQDGAVASSSLLFIVLAVVCGCSLRWFKPKMRVVLLVFLPLLALCVYLGERYPIEEFPAALRIFETEKFNWSFLLLIYCFIAGVIPVWMLLQPRDFLSSFLLYAAVFGAAAGLAVGVFGGGGGLEARWPVFLAEPVQKGVPGPLFPFLFITIACGACSGFHSLVSSGTTVRQVKSERAGFRVGYGSMLIEGFVAVIALLTVVILSVDGARDQHPVAVFSGGVGKFLATLGIPESTGRHFAFLAVSTFLLTTLDTCTRLTRYIVQDFLKMDNRKAMHRYAATAVALAIPAAFAFLSFHDAEGKAIPLWKMIWPIFGASNQLLAALALLAVTIWMKRVGRKYLFAAIPMVFMLTVTLSGLVMLAVNNGVNSLVGGISAVLAVLGVLIAYAAFQALGKPPLNCETPAVAREEASLKD